MNEKLYPSLQPQVDSLEQHLNLRLKEINSFNNSIQNIKILKIFIIMKPKSIKRKVNNTSS